VKNSARTRDSRKSMSSPQRRGELIQIYTSNPSIK
jgi:hypothetical protein